MPKLGNSIVVQCICCQPVRSGAFGHTEVVVGEVVCGVSTGLMCARGRDGPRNPIGSGKCRFESAGANV